VGRKNIIHIDFDKPNASSITKLLATIESIHDENDEVVEGSLRKLITEALDTFEIATSETTREIKNLNDFLIRSNEEMIQDINEFIDKNKGNEITKRSVDKFKRIIFRKSFRNNRKCSREFI
jgi:Na+/phosphate symporter